MSNLTEDDLEYHVDRPMRPIVSMFNLLGIRTMWCCCGFDYDGQPEFKSHVYGDTHVYLTYCNGKALDFLVQTSLNAGWKLTVANVSCTTAWRLHAPFKFGGDWKRKDSVHHHESANVSIKNLERQLIKSERFFKDEVTLVDENHVMEKHFDEWQYKGRNPWTITKESLQPKIKSLGNTKKFETANETFTIK